MQTCAGLMMFHPSNHRSIQRCYLLKLLEDNDLGQDGHCFDPSSTSLLQFSLDIWGNIGVVVIFVTICEISEGTSNLISTNMFGWGVVFFHFPYYQPPAIPPAFPGPEMCGSTASSTTSVPTTAAPFTHNMCIYTYVKLIQFSHICSILVFFCFLDRVQVCSSKMGNGRIHHLYPFRSMAAPCSHRCSRHGHGLMWSPRIPNPLKGQMIIWEVISSPWVSLHLPMKTSFQANSNICLYIYIYTHVDKIFWPSKTTLHKTHIECIFPPTRATQPEGALPQQLGLSFEATQQEGWTEGKNQIDSTAPRKASRCSEKKGGETQGKNMGKIGFG